MSNQMVVELSMLTGLKREEMITENTNSVLLLERLRRSNLVMKAVHRDPT